MTTAEQSILQSEQIKNFKFYDNLNYRLEMFQTLLEKQLVLSNQAQTRKELKDFGDQAALFIIQVLRLLKNQPLLTKKLLQVIKYRQYFFSKKLK